MSLNREVDDENIGVDSNNNVDNENNDLVNENEEKYEIIEFNDWEEMDLKKDVLRGIYSYGFEKPSPIQKKAIKPIFDGKDVIAQAQSGTGKTGAFCVGALQVLNSQEDKMQVLIVAPTRELSRQIQ